MPSETIQITTPWESYNSSRIRMSGTLPYTGFRNIAVTITPVDATKPIQYNFVGKDANGTTVADLYWYNSGTMIDIPTSAGITQWLIWGRYSNDGSISPSAVQSAEATLIFDQYWTGTEGEYPDNPDFIPRPSLLGDEPLPLWAFRQDDLTNRGYPYLILFPDLERITLNTVRQREYITVYDMLSDKPAFLTNGLAILTPTAAPIHEVINGEYSVTLTHPIDAIGKWRYIRESNIVKVQGQLYTIKRVEWTHTSENSGTVTAYCEHIFYQLNDLWIFGEQNREPAQFAYCKSAMDSIMDRCVDYDEGTMYRFAYDWTSNWEWGGSSPWTFIVDGAGQTPVEKLIGSGGIIAEKGGELYRDNFHFSINERMENAQDNAFDLRFGANMRGMKRTVDTSTLALWLSLTDEETGAMIAISYDGRNFPLFQFPHNIVRSQTIRYEQDFYDWFWEQMYAGVDVNDVIFERLYADLLALWKSSCTPIICYDVDVQDLKDIYPELTDHYKYKVGNSGTIYDELLGGKVTLKITETETDGITGEVTRIVFGSKNSFTRSAGYPLEFDAEPNEKTYETPLRDSRGKLLYDSRGKQIMRRGVL